MPSQLTGMRGDPCASLYWDVARGDISVTGFGPGSTSARLNFIEKTFQNSLKLTLEIEIVCLQVLDLFCNCNLRSNDEDGQKYAVNSRTAMNIDYRDCSTFSCDLHED